jgi:hypothetical protein
MHDYQKTMRDKSEKGILTNVKRFGMSGIAAIVD